MGKTVKSRVSKEVSSDERRCDRTDPLRNIAGIAFYMESQIQDAIGVARTAKHRSNDAESDGEDYSCSAALDLILYRLEQIQEGHALITENAPYTN